MGNGTSLRSAFLRPSRRMYRSSVAVSAPATTAGLEKHNRKSVVSRSVRLGIDAPLLLVSITLMIFGLLMVFSASWEYSFAEDGSPTSIFIRQFIYMLLGCAIAAFLAWMDYRTWRKLAIPAMALTIGSLVGVLIVNDVRHNAVRTLFSGSIQPSELAKLVIVIYLAVWLFAKREQLNDKWFGLIPLAAILGFIGGLIFLQPDLSAVLTIVLLGGIMFFLAGGDLRQIAILMVVGIIVGTFVVQISPTGQARVEGFLVALKDPTKASYHVQRSLEAFVKGGWFGVGIGKADTKLTGLPVPHTDSIFAVVGEETGVIGAAVLVLLYCLLLWRGMLIARRAPDGLGSLLAAGLTLWIVMEAFINMAVMVNLLPFAGNALPFISAGGSNLVVSLAGIGILLNISRATEKNKEIEEKSFSAVIDLRRRDRGGSVSRPGNPANHTATRTRRPAR